MADTATLIRNKLKRKHRHERAVLAAKHKRIRVPRGTARALRRRDIVSFKAQRRAKAQQFTGTVLVNAPSLSMLNRYISEVPA